MTAAASPGLAAEAQIVRLQRLTWNRRNHSWQIVYSGAAAYSRSVRQVSHVARVMHAAPLPRPLSLTHFPAALFASRILRRRPGLILMAGISWKRPSSIQR